MDIDGDAHGKMYLELAEGKEQGPWQQTFVKNVGYKNFAWILSLAWEENLFLVFVFGAWKT